LSFTEKIDILDLIINVLKDHEEKLDHIITRFELRDKLDPAPVAHTPQRDKAEGQGSLHPEPSVILVRTENEQLIVEHLLRETYAVSERIIEETGLASPSFYYSLKRLRERGLVEEAGTVARKVGGPAVKIWTLKEVK